MSFLMPDGFNNSKEGHLFFDVYIRFLPPGEPYVLPGHGLRCNHLNRSVRVRKRRCIW